jgi:hypothetical protein
MPNITLPNLVRRPVCPHCWKDFPPEEILWVSAHTDLLGDARLGPRHQQRFLPTHFNLEGNAVDAKNFVCTQLACPRCHLTMPRALLEMEPYFASIIGHPACGKSYFLAAMTWELQSVLPQQFANYFIDADPAANRQLEEYKESMFMNEHGDKLVSLLELIRKTEREGELYDVVSYGDQEVRYARPFVFTLQPQESHPHYSNRDRYSRTLCLYDNAGEDFLPGMDTTNTPGTQHLAQSRLLLFLFDPTLDQRFRLLCQQRGITSVSMTGGKVGQQVQVLNEAAARIRRYTGLAHNARHDRPLMFVVTKFDAWSKLLEGNDPSPPWVQVGNLAGLDVGRIERRSQLLRALLLKVCPELVAAAESFATSVTYIPVSALGRTPELDPATNHVAIRPKDIAPVWVAVPLLYALCAWPPYVIPGARLRGRNNGQPPPRK